jgi:hypothetical protein
VSNLTPWALGGSSDTSTDAVDQASHCPARSDKKAVGHPLVRYGQRKKDFSATDHEAGQTFQAPMI